MLMKNNIVIYLDSFYRRTSWYTYEYKSGAKRTNESTSRLFPSPFFDDQSATIICKQSAKLFFSSLYCRIGIFLLFDFSKISSFLVFYFYLFDFDAGPWSFSFYPLQGTFDFFVLHLGNFSLSKGCQCVHRWWTDQLQRRSCWWNLLVATCRGSGIAFWISNSEWFWMSWYHLL